MDNHKQAESTDTEAQVLEFLPDVSIVQHRTDCAEGGVGRTKK